MMLRVCESEDDELVVHCRPSTLHTDSLLSSKEDVQVSDMRQWSSTDSSGYSTDGSSRLRVNVTKASSFHGVTVLSRADTGTSGCYVTKTGNTFHLVGSVEHLV